MELIIDYLSDDKIYTTPHCVLKLNLNGASIRFTIEELYCYDSEILKNIRYCMENGGTSSSIGGGGNSFWNLWCDNCILHLDYEISGMGCDSRCELRLPCKEYLSAFDKLIKLRECISENIKYED
jgi:hypothetical protein